MRSEFAFINKLKKKTTSELGTQHRELILGIGDDAAIIKKDSKHDYIVSTDMLVEDIDFRLDCSLPSFLGHKALAVSLSDIAAMGARPLFAMLSIGIPKQIWRTKFVDEFYKGWFALASEHNVQLIGGDVSRVTDKIVIDSFVIGEVKRGKAVTRSGAKPGDLMFVTGNLGGAAAGLNLECCDLSQLLRLQRKRGDRSPHSKLLLKQLKPNAQVEIGVIIGKENLATAMIDISDGLSSDLAHLCRESSVGAIIEACKIPVEPAIASYFPNEQEQLNFALNGGEDFELLFTVNPNKVKKLTLCLEDYKISNIGVVTEKANHTSIMANGRKKSLRAKGFIHF